MSVGNQAATGASNATVSGFGDIASTYNTLMNNFSSNALGAGTGIAQLSGNTGNALLGAYGNLGQNVAGQYTDIGNAKATAAYATAQIPWLCPAPAPSPCSDTSGAAGGGPRAMTWTQT